MDKISRCPFVMNCIDEFWNSVLPYVYWVLNLYQSDAARLQALVPRSTDDENEDNDVGFSMMDYLRGIALSHIDNNFSNSRNTLRHFFYKNVFNTNNL